MPSNPEFAIFCQASCGASDSRHIAPKSLLFVRAFAASNKRGRYIANTTLSSLLANGFGPKTISASTENSCRAQIQSHITLSSLILSKLAGTCIWACSLKETK